MRDVYFKLGAIGRKSVLLDYGCGDGSFLESAAPYSGRSFGFEVSKEHAEELSRQLRVPIYSSSELLLKDLEGEVDVLTMHFVVEHLTDLKYTFALISKLLRPGGIFYCVVPNIESWEFRLFREKWHGLDPPRHISFPDMNVVNLLSRANGLEVNCSQHAAFPNGFAGSVPAALTGRFSFPIFAVALPLGVLASKIAPSGVTAFFIKKL